MPSSVINSDDGVISGTSGLKSSGGDDGVLNIQSNGTTVAAVNGSGVTVTGTLSASGATTLSGAVSASSLTVNSNNISADNSLGFRNRIINGDMRIDQRNAGASITPTNGSYIVDRFGFYGTPTSKFSMQQNAGSVTPPAGFTNYLGFTSLSAYSIGSTEWFQAYQVIEGNNISDLSFGTANAKTITLSFWVRSSLTGTFGGFLANSAADRLYVFSYSINSANTWEQKTITISGDTTGTWLTNNGAGLSVVWSLGCGSSVTGSAGSWGSTVYRSVTGQVNVSGTNGATFYITGVQLEVGSVATPFERRPYGTELMLCQRYYYKITAPTGNSQFGPAVAGSSTTGFASGNFPVTMRTRPTALEQSGTAADYTIEVPAGSAKSGSTVPGYNGITNQFNWVVGIAVASGMTAGQAGILYSANTNAFLAWSAEL